MATEAQGSPGEIGDQLAPVVQKGLLDSLEKSGLRVSQESASALNEALEEAIEGAVGQALAGQQAAGLPEEAEDILDETAGEPEQTPELEQPQEVESPQPTEYSDEDLDNLAGGDEQYRQVLGGLRDQERERRGQAAPPQDVPEETPEEGQPVEEAEPETGDPAEAANNIDSFGEEPEDENLANFDEALDDLGLEDEDGLNVDDEIADLAGDDEEYAKMLQGLKEDDQNLRKAMEGKDGLPGSDDKEGQPEGAQGQPGEEQGRQASEPTPDGPKDEDYEKVKDDLQNAENDLQGDTLRNKGVGDDPEHDALVKSLQDDERDLQKKKKDAAKEPEDEDAPDQRLSRRKREFYAKQRRKILNKADKFIKPRQKSLQTLNKLRNSLAQKRRLLRLKKWRERQKIATRFVIAVIVTIISVPLLLIGVGEGLIPLTWKKFVSDFKKYKIQMTKIDRLINDINKKIKELDKKIKSEQKEIQKLQRAVNKKLRDLQVKILGKEAASPGVGGRR